MHSFLQRISYSSLCKGSVQWTAQSSAIRFAAVTFIPTIKPIQSDTFKHCTIMKLHMGDPPTPTCRDCTAPKSTLRIPAYPESATPLVLDVEMIMDGPGAGANDGGGKVQRLYGVHCERMFGSTLSIGGCCRWYLVSFCQAIPSAKICSVAVPFRPRSMPTTHMKERNKLKAVLDPQGMTMCQGVSCSQHCKICHLWFAIGPAKEAHSPGVPAPAAWECP